MKSRHSSYFLAFGAALLLGIAARAQDTSTSIKFSEPSKPGTVRINLGQADLRIEGADTAEVTVKSDAKPVNNKRTKDGLRVLSAASSFGLSEKDNVVFLDAGPEFGHGRSAFRLTVPRTTSIIVQNAFGGDFTCSGISGDIEISNMHGEIKLDDVSGSIVASTMNGQIRATLKTLQEGKAISFTSMNGEVVVRVPDNTKANVRLRTQNGSVLTDFDENVLVTKAETVSGGPGRFKTASAWRGGSKVITAEVEEAIREATRLSATAVAEALEAVKEGLEEARLNSDEARRQVDQARQQIDKARREFDRARSEERRTTQHADSEQSPKPPKPPAAPTPAAAPKPPLMGKVPITITGGKLVTGTLNGGGPEISVSTMNGDVVIRKL